MKLLRSVLVGAFFAASLVTAFAQSANNNLANRFLIVPGATTTNGTTAGGNNRETNEATPAGQGGFPSGATVWHEWIAPSSGAVSMTAAGTGYRIVLSVWTGGAHPLTQVVSVRAGSAGATATANFTATAGVSYKVMLDGSFNGGGGQTGPYTLTTPTPAVVPIVMLTTPVNGQVITKSPAGHLHRQRQFGGRYGHECLLFPRGQRPHRLGDQQPVHLRVDERAIRFAHRLRGGHGYVGCRRFVRDGHDLGFSFRLFFFHTYRLEQRDRHELVVELPG